MSEKLGIVALGARLSDVGLIRSEGISTARQTAYSQPNTRFVWRILLLRIVRRVLCLAVTALWMSACTSSAPVSLKAGTASQQGFWGRLSDLMTERQCSVYRFSCPYGFGPAGEPCDCTDPRGVVLQGRTVKQRELCTHDTGNGCRLRSFGSEQK